MKITVRRTRPSAAAWIACFCITVLMILLMAIGVRQSARAPRMTFASPDLATRDVELTAEEAFLIVLGEYPRPDEARLQAARLTFRGSAGYVWQSDGACAVLGNVYFDRLSAERAICLLSEQAIAARLEALRLPALTITLRATQTQIDRFLTSRAALSRARTALVSLSERLDAGQIDAATARAQALVAAYDLQDAKEAFFACVPAGGDSLTECHRALLTQTLNDLTALAGGQETEMYLSSRAKCALIRYLLAEAELRGMAD